MAEALEDRLARRARVLVSAGLLLWIAAASAGTLWSRYAKPSRYVLHAVARWEPHL